MSVLERLLKNRHPIKTSTSTADCGRICIIADKSGLLEQIKDLIVSCKQQKSNSFPFMMSLHDDSQKCN